MKCPKCGKEIPGDSLFCNYCGKPTPLNNEYIDLGLPSGTIWKSKNEEGFYNFDEAVKKYGINLPTKEQLQELKDQCKWEWLGKGYRVTGPNGNSIVLPAAGYSLCDSGVGSNGYYRSSTPGGLGNAWIINFNSGRVNLHSLNRYCRMSVRLVQD